MRISAYMSHIVLHRVFPIFRPTSRNEILGQGAGKPYGTSRENAAQNEKFLGDTLPRSETRGIGPRSPAESTQTGGNSKNRVKEVKKKEAKTRKGKGFQRNPNKG